MKTCYCGKCEMPFITCTQWDCPGATRIAGAVSHYYDCEFCENRRKALMKKKQTPPQASRETQGSEEENE